MVAIKEIRFTFAHYDCNYVAFNVDGRSVPSVQYEPNFESKQYVSSYTGLGMEDKQNCLITKEDFSGGYAIYAFNVTPHVDRHCLPLIKKGHIRLEVKFAKPLPEAVTVVCYAHFQGLMTTDSSREVRVR